MSIALTLPANVKRSVVGLRRGCLAMFVVLHLYVDLWVLMACLSSVLALTAFINYTALRDEQAMR